jgi:hypothetical protein
MMLSIKKRLLFWVTQYSLTLQYETVINTYRAVSVSMVDMSDPAEGVTSGIRQASSKIDHASVQHT